MTYAILNRGEVEVHLTQMKPERAGQGSAYIYVSGMDADYEALRDAGAEFTVTLADQVYGMPDFQVVDPDGNLLVFGEPAAED